MPLSFACSGTRLERSHARLGVDLEQINAGLALLVVPAEVGARRALAAEQPVRPRRHVHHRRGDLVGDFGRADVLGQAVGIFRVIIVEAGLGLELGDRQRLVAEHRDGQLAALDERLGEQLVEMLPRAFDVAADRVAVIAVVGDDRDADRRAFVDRLQHIGPRHRIFAGRGSRSRRSCPRACGCRAAPAPSWSAPCRSR